jgi:hypothetical protein
MPTLKSAEHFLQQRHSQKLVRLRLYVAMVDVSSVGRLTPAAASCNACQSLVVLASTM